MEGQDASSGYLEVQEAKYSGCISEASSGRRHASMHVMGIWVSGGARGKQWASGSAGGKLWVSGGAGGNQCLWASGGAGGVWPGVQEASSGHLEVQEVSSG